MRVGFLLWLTLLICSMTGGAGAPAFVTLDPPETTQGYLASLLINEVPFPGEAAYVSEAETKGAMLAVLWVLHSRLRHIPPGYTQVEVAGVRTDRIVDVITGGGGRRQCEGFYLNGQGKPVTAPRVQERIAYLRNIANQGNRPGRFAQLLQYAQGLASAYVAGGIQGVDRFAGLRRVGKVDVTGRGFSWMTDVERFHPGGNFVAIPDELSGSLGGNRFYTLRKVPK